MPPVEARNMLANEMKMISTAVENLPKVISDDVRTKMEELPGQIHDRLQKSMTKLEELPGQIHDRVQNSLGTITSLGHELGDTAGRFQASCDEHRKLAKEELNALSDMVKTDITRFATTVRTDIADLPGRVKHVTEDSMLKVLNEVASMKTRFGADILESEKRMLASLEQLPREVERQIKNQFGRMTDSMQGEFSSMKAHVSDMKTNVASRVKDASSLCGTPTRAGSG
jgi:ElaB/YqjD/DUF883 family membrane-anchored ribosome-binding protein